MEDRQLSTTWKVALMWPLSGGAGALLSSDAHQSQNVANPPKIQIWHSPKMMPSRLKWPRFSKKSAWSIYTTFDISFLPPDTRDWCIDSAVWVSVSGFFRGASLNLSSLFGLWRGCNNQLGWNRCWDWTERCWISFNPAKVCIKEWNCVCLRYSHNVEPIAFSPIEK